MTSSDLRYCPRCAAELMWQDAGRPASRQPVCTSCGFVLWQNLKPSVEAIIVRGTAHESEVLLGRLGTGSGTGKWDIPGGFLNADDRIEAALWRECKREVGVEIEIERLLGVYEDVFAGSRIITVIYVCRIASGEPYAADIVDAVGWFTLDELPEIAHAAVREALDDLGSAAPSADAES